MQRRFGTFGATLSVVARHFGGLRGGNMKRINPRVARFPASSTVSSQGTLLLAERAKLMRPARHRSPRLGLSVQASTGAAYARTRNVKPSARGHNITAIAIWNLP
jgi:hypothetical protein